jgi:molybdopterin-guanine dinucleotide biosynthesis protein A
MITSALMAGGKSIRMGRDKCLIEVDGIPLWRRQLDLLSSFSKEVFVVAPNRPAWLPDNTRWIPDIVRDEGPIGGLAAALIHATCPNGLVLAVDMPAMTSAFLRKLLAIMSPRTGIVPEIEGRYEPLSAIYSYKTLRVVKDQLLVGKNNSLQSLLHRLIQNGLMQTFPITSTELGLFRNLNSPLDLEGATSMRAVIN